jgi:3-oxoacyl-[acyl-carrier-protein] synthase-3
MKGTRIIGLGRHLPERIVTNAEIEALCGTSDEWIRQRTGIRERRWVEGDVGASDLALPASQAALEQAGISPADLDLIVFATLSPDLTFPGSSCLLQAKLGCPGVAILDIRNQCTGFLYALAVADQFIRTGAMRRILVVGAEVHSSGLEMAPRGRDVTPLFGDGAGAAVLEATDGPARILDSALHGDGRFVDILRLTAPASNRNPRLTWDMVEKGEHFPHMEGRAVFRHAVERLPEVIMELLGRQGIALDEVDLFFPHQATLRINEFVASRMGIPKEKFFNNIDRYGNTTAASIPIALSEARESGLLRDGMLTVLAAFGAGLTWAATLVRF